LEDPKGRIDWGCDPKIEAIWREINTLYRWWKDRFYRSAQHNHPTMKFWQVEELWHNEDTEMMVRLIHIRGFLWT
jgi:hypothetical protein